MNSDKILQFITVFSPPGEVVETATGPLRYSEWLESEKKRIQRTEWPLQVVTNDKGEIALAILKIDHPERAQ